MIVRRLRHPTACALSGLLCLLLPAVAAAASTSDPITGGGGLSAAPTASPITGGAPVSAAGDGGVSLSTVSTALLRHQLTFTGTAPAGKTVEIQRQGQATQWAWAPTVEAVSGTTGTFATSWTASQSGQFAVRAIVVPTGSPVALDPTAASTSSVTVTVYRGSRATIYGPGFYGRRTACGSRLTSATLGVANRTLPCGSSVSILYGGQTLTVPVIDRGPYANHADWDLTMATADALGMSGTSQIGTAVIPASTVEVPSATRDAARLAR